MSPSPRPPPRPRAAHDQAAPAAVLARAAAHHRAGRLQDAESAYVRFLAAHPGWAPALHLYGVLLAQTGRAPRGAEEIAKAVPAQPANPAYLNDWGNALMAADRWREAIAAYDRALAARRDFPGAQFNRANALLRAGDAAAALIAYDGVLDARPAASVLVNRSLALAQLARFDEAIDGLRQAVALAPGDREALINLALSLKRIGRTAEAAEALASAVAADPGFAEAFAVLGGIHHDAERAAEARAAFERALAVDSRHAGALAGLAAVAHDDGRFDESEAMLQRVLAQRPMDSEALTNLGLARQEGGNEAGAVEAFARALAADPRNKRAIAHLAIALQQCGRREEARAIFDFDRLIAVRDIEAVAGYESVADFNAAVAHYVLNDPSLMLDRPAIATTKGSQTLEILVGENKERRALHAMIEREVLRYIDGVLKTSGNAHADQATARWRVTGWAVVLHSGGHQSPHIHPQGFASGVYYIRVPETVRVAEAGDAGHIAFGKTKPWGAAADAQKDFLSRTEKPVEGRMVLFPSHFWHHTVPFESAEKRICVAFDVVPA